MIDQHLGELIRQCADATQLKRLNSTEQAEIFTWLLDGHMTRTGKPLRRPKQHPQPIAHNPDNGAPIYPKGADFSPTETVEMPANG